jgi:hypothetical protein
MTAGAWLIVRAYPWVLYAVLALWAAAGVSAWSRLRRRLSLTPAPVRIALGGVLLLALALRVFPGPRHRVYFDEFEHLDAARALARGQGYTETVIGGLPELDARTPPTWPAGHHAALSLVMRVFGPSDLVAFLWSADLSLLTVLLVFWAALELFDDARGAVLAAAFWALAPPVLAYARAADLTSPSLFWMAAALAGLAAARREDSWELCAFGALSAAYAAQVRFENAVLVLALPFVLPKRRRVLAVPAAALLAFPALLLSSNARAGIPGFAGGDLAVLGNAARNLPADLAFLGRRFWASLVLVPAALWTLVRPEGRGRRRHRAAAHALCLLSAVYLCGISGFFRGDFSHGTEDRYALPVLLPLTVAAGPGLSPLAAPAAVVFALLALRQPAAPVSAEHADSLAFARAAAEKVPADAFVADFNPSFAAEATGRPVVAAQVLGEDLAGFRAQAARAGAAPELYLLEDAAWRFSGARAEALARSLAADYAFETVVSSGPDALVRLTPRAGR